MKRKILSTLLVLCMLVSLLPTFALAATTYNDTQDHWAADAIDRWSGYGVVNGKGEGSFDPDGQMTRAEAAQVFANLLGLNKEGDISAYPDAQGEWYSEAIAKCVAAGILNGKGAGKMDPNGTVTREEFLTMYARAVCISNGADVAQAKSELEQKGFADTAKVSDWAADSIGTLVDKGYVNGLTATELAPQANINRASVMALLNQSISTYVGKDSTETTVTAKSEGITLIANPAVTSVTGTADVVVVAAGAEQYDAATGEITHNDIRVESAKMPVARVQGENITVTLALNTEAEDAEVTETAVKSEIVVESTATVNKLTVSAEGAKATVSGKVESVTVAETAKSATVETKSGSTVGTLNVAAEDAKTTVAGKVETVKVEETAKNVAVETTSTAKVTTVENKAENTAVTGSGSVGAVKSSEDVKIETKNTKVENTSETKDIAVTDSKGTETKVETKTEGTATTKPETTVNTQETTSGGGGGSSSYSFDFVLTTDSLPYGEKYKFTTTMENVNWSVDNGDLASIENDGTLLAKNFEATVKVYAEYNGKTISHDVNLVLFHGGTGEENDPYEIYNKEQFKYMWYGYQEYGEKLYYELVNDIDFENTDPYSYAYSGIHLEGNNHILSNGRGPLFSQMNWSYDLYLSNFTIKNFVSDYSLICNYGAYNVKSEQIYDNIDVIDCVAKGGAFFLPWVYDNYNITFRNCDIRDSTVNNDVTSQGFVAGFVGNGKSTVTIDNCTMKANVVSSNPIVAGIIGSGGSGNATVNNCSILPGTTITQKGTGSASAIGSATITNTTCYATIIKTNSSGVNKNGFDDTVAYISQELGFSADDFAVCDNGSVYYTGDDTIAKLGIYQTVTTNRLHDGEFENGGFPTSMRDTVFFENVSDGTIENAVNYITDVKNVTNKLTEKLYCSIKELPTGLEFNNYGFAFDNGTLYLDADQGEGEYTSNYFAGTLKSKDNANNIAVTVYFVAYDSENSLLGTFTKSYSVALGK